MVMTRPPKTIVGPTALGTGANTDTKLLIYRLFQKGRVLAQNAVLSRFTSSTAFDVPEATAHGNRDAHRQRSCGVGA